GGQAGNKGKAEEDYTCPEDSGNGNYADPVTCRRFYQCVDGYPYLNRCPSGLYFDDISKLCTFKEEARCGPINTRVEYQINNLSFLHLQTPQMILLTFDGAINLNNFDLYRKVFENDERRNPNGCPLRGTFFVAHEYSNYHMVQQLAHESHEIATETISLQRGLEDKGYEEWVGEMIGMREILHHFANVSRSDVVGMRAPYLKPGRNTQYEVLQDFGYIYDSSMGVPPTKVPIWPYTLDYKIPHECRSDTCPSRSFPGVWEVPLNAHYVESYEGGHCPFLDQCVLHSHDANEVFEWLQEDFSRHRDQNKAPYMMPFHTNWFQIKALVQGLHKFIDWTLTQHDVWYVTITQALVWMTDPRTLKEINSGYDAWKCARKPEELPAAPCNLPNKCALSFRPPEANFSTTRYLTTCRECPNKYPWLGDSEGTGIAGRDVYNPEN
ncbi:hypothetical protein J437_LFUL012427, partial [Ladona fulva]